MLAMSPEAREVLAEAMRLLGYEEDAGDDAEPEADMTAPPPAAAVRGGAPRRRPRWLTPLLAAAAVAAVSLVPLLRSPPPAGSFGDAGRLLSVGPTLLGEGWDRHDWTVTRSEGVVLPLESTAFRVGVRWTDAQVAWGEAALGDAAEQLASISVLLDGVPLGSPAARVAAELRTAVEAGRTPDEAEALIADGRRRLEALLPTPYLKLGSWAESTRLAARSGAVDFLRDPRTTDELTAAASQALPPSATEALAEVRSLIGGGDFSPAALQRLAEALDRLIAQLGG